MAISNEKRTLLIEAKLRGETEENIAVWLNISTGSVSGIWKLYKETGSILPKKNLGRTSSITGEKSEKIQKFVFENPDKTLEEIIEELELPIKKSQLSRLLISLGFSYKKKALIQPSRISKMCKKNDKFGKRKTEKI